MVLDFLFWHFYFFVSKKKRTGGARYRKEKEKKKERGREQRNERQHNKVSQKTRPENKRCNDARVNVFLRRGNEVLRGK